MGSGLEWRGAHVTLTSNNQWVSDHPAEEEEEFEEDRKEEEESVSEVSDEE